MSRSSAIAAVTAALQDVLTVATAGLGTVTAGPPDRPEGDSENVNVLNVFLYQVLPNPAWRNLDFPTAGDDAAGGETDRSVPPVALNLHYVITAFSGKRGDDTPAHLLIGAAIAALDGQPLLNRARIAGLSDTAHPGVHDSGLDAQLERVRFTLHPLQLDDLYKLWSGFQTSYRLSVAYEAAVVLIDPQLPQRAALPVLSRGKDDRGVDATAGLAPTLAEIVLPVWRGVGTANPTRQSVAMIGQTVTLVGQGLFGDAVTVRFTPLVRRPVPDQPREPITIAAVADADGLTVLLDSQALSTSGQSFRAGVYTAQVVVARAGGELVSNALPLTIGPRVTRVLSAGSVGVDDVELEIHVDPELDVDQDAVVFLGSRAIAVGPRAQATDVVTVAVTDPTAGTFVVRLRVDDVDSMPVDLSASRKPEFDPNQKATIVA